MYSVRIISPMADGRHVRVQIESYTDVAVALRVAMVRARVAGVLALVQRPNGDVLARFGLESASAA